ncbi:MAG: 50S ribosomal protein L6 [Legionellales bacterium]|nr:50S ribosomal protein L6 [Legionellales bacterium]OUX64324.1 MAG: 50S ribosomal protein L6 [Gammaproteobacteria bacterium TMED281]
MSKVARNPIVIPSDVKLSIDGQKIIVEKGGNSLERVVHDSVQIIHNENKLTFKAKEGYDNARAQSGTERSLVNNNVIGITQGFVEELSIVGVGYKAALQGNTLVLNLGYSHQIHYEIPEGINIEVPTQTEVVIKGINKQVVGQASAHIQDYRRPDPYKGKGVRKKGVNISLKEGKKK